jgi:hypothetical protein
MATSLFLARLLGPVFLLIGIGLVFDPDSFRKLLREFTNNPVLVYLAGILGLMGGLAVVLTHNVWIADLRVVITLVGWVALIRGVVTILAPQWLVSVANRIFENKRNFLAAAGIDLIVGVMLSYFGYAARLI